MNDDLRNKKVNLFGAAHARRRTPPETTTPPEMPGLEDVPQTSPPVPKESNQKPASVPQLVVEQSNNQTFYASMYGVPFCEFQFDRDSLRDGLMQGLKQTTFEEQLKLVLRAHPDTPEGKQAAVDETFKMLQLHAEVCAQFMQENLRFIFSSTLETYLQIGELHANNERAEVCGTEPKHISAEQISKIFEDSAMRAVKQHARAGGGRPQKVTDAEIRNALDAFGGDASIKQVADYLGKTYDDVSNWRRRKRKTWKEAKEDACIVCM
jgi:hypothetical protein